MTSSLRVSKRVWTKVDTDIIYLERKFLLYFMINDRFVIYRSDKSQESHAG